MIIIVHEKKENKNIYARYIIACEPEPIIFCFLIFVKSIISICAFSNALKLEGQGNKKSVKGGTGINLIIMHKKNKNIYARYIMACEPEPIISCFLIFVKSIISICAFSNALKSNSIGSIVCFLLNKCFVKLFNGALNIVP